ncbi:MAG: glycerophosphodiester phosphodiesterase [Zetaproteobacteria bacterium CG1_02_53_45]|nr:MAG: glycerophosphodiester phosphodiesterase [Zetaproteobacteria bacterium CG1_02_53_45]
MQQHPITPEQHLVAHRGDRAGGIENTLAAFKYAAAAGARFAECDIQFTRDLVPVVIHDNWLKRLCGQPDVKVMQTDFADLFTVCAPHFELLTLAGLLHWLQSQPQLTMFIEIKPATLRRLSAGGAVRRLAAMLPAARLDQIVLISQSATIIETCKQQLDCRTGWVAESHRQPGCDIDYIFMPYNRSAAIAFWHERGVKVGLYTVNEVAPASELLAQQVDLIETDHYASMAASLA